MARDKLTEDELKRVVLKALKFKTSSPEHEGYLEPSTLAEYIAQAVRDAGYVKTTDDYNSCECAGCELTRSAVIDINKGLPPVEEMEEANEARERDALADSLTEKP